MKINISGREILPVAVLQNSAVEIHYINKEYMKSQR